MDKLSSRFVHRTFNLGLGLLLLPLLVHAQDHFPPLTAPQLKPMVKMTGFVNAKPTDTNVYPILTLQLQGEDKPYTFLLTDMKVMAGPLRTSESILSEVKPYKPNFRIRTSRDITARLVSASPTEQLTFMALYSQSDRVLIVETLETPDEEKEQKN